MRILHCIPTLGGGGAERQLAYLLPIQARRGWDVHLAYLHDGPNRELLRDTDVTLHPPRRQSEKDPRTALELFRCIRRLRPDVVQTWLLYMDVVAGWFCPRLKIPWVMTERSAGPMRQCRWYRNLPRRCAGAKASAIVSNSPAGDAYWARAAKGNTLRYVIGNCLPLDRLEMVEPIVDADGIDLTRKVVLYVGRMDVEKNTETLVTVFRRLLAQRDDVDVVLCGQGDRRKAIREALTGSRAHAIGFTDNVWAWMKRADVLVNPSHFEGHPNAVLEAAALGTPLVLSDILAHRAIFSDESARFAPTMDVDAWIAQINETLDDTAAALQRANRARNIVSQYTPDAMADAYEQVYRDVRQKKKQGRILFS